MILGQDFDGFVDTLEDATKERVLLAMTELVPQYADVPAPTTGPPDNFAATIWPGLVEAMASEGYYLSMDELLLVSDRRLGQLRLQLGHPRRRRHLPRPCLFLHALL